MVKIEENTQEEDVLANLGQSRFNLEKVHNFKTFSMFCTLT
jgi:hypothetical protein